MRDALNRVYVLQQRELNEKERQRQQQIAKRQRLLAAFNASGFIDIYNEFQSIPTRMEVRQRVYKSTVGELSYNYSMPTNQWHSVSFASINGCSNGPRWWCEENLANGNMRYGYSSGAVGCHQEFFTTPTGEWLNSFVDYLAAAADPDEVAKKVQSSSNNPATTVKRQLQTV